MGTLQEDAKRLQDCIDALKNDLILRLLTREAELLLEPVEGELIIKGKTVTAHWNDPKKSNDDAIHALIGEIHTRRDEIRKSYGVNVSYIGLIPAGKSENSEFKGSKNWIIRHIEPEIPESDFFIEADKLNESDPYNIEVMGEDAGDLYPKEVKLADAKLIVVSHEMLEALQWFVDRCDKGEIRSKKTYARFKELIKKATK